MERKSLEHPEAAADVPIPAPPTYFCAEHPDYSTLFFPASHTRRAELLRTEGYTVTPLYAGDPLEPRAVE